MNRFYKIGLIVLLVEMVLSIPIIIYYVTEHKNNQDQIHYKTNRFNESENSQEDFTMKVKKDRLTVGELDRKIVIGMPKTALYKQLGKPDEISNSYESDNVIWQYGIGMKNLKDFPSDLKRDEMALSLMREGKASAVVSFEFTDDDQSLLRWVVVKKEKNLLVAYRYDKKGIVRELVERMKDK